MDIGLVTAFFGGALAILSPCGALLLPAFFASTVGSGPRLLLHGGIFYAGLLLVLVPLGVGAGAIGALFITHRTAIIGGASLLLVALGVMQIFGFGFDAARLLPGGRALQDQADSRVGLLKTFLLGATSGVAGFCAGPILGAVLTMAAAQGSVVAAGVLLGIYGAGMVVPLLVIAALWGRIGERARRALRGRTFTVAGRDFHTTSVITGVLIAAVGVLFWATNGLVTVPALLPTSVSAWLQGRSSVLANGWVDIAAIVLVAGVVLVLWWRAQGRRVCEEGEA
ncbi:cytochrome c biogenesis CcdA family protein [Tessaracoccus caeni]|uniref:cytochrome c biogenesis CcdA family protein n=1 Tax=Tessaracoccus caeni TaxID=3031239 RepID=UPI0023DCADD9|nr:cytochrome c biogenesis CcdA family protein [Tessaracoccus caeni]MDF1487606.1 cytochrome c biogenesis CcdA family protein [Tessaracoccus caeni]